MRKLAVPLRETTRGVLLVLYVEEEWSAPAVGAVAPLHIFAGTIVVFLS